MFNPRQETQSVPSKFVGPGYDFSQWSRLGLTESRYSALRKNEDVYSVISRLSNTMAGLPIHLYQKYQQVDKTPSDLLNGSANPSLSSYQLINSTEVSRNVDGNGYIFIERDPKTGVPINLWPIDTATVTIERNIEDGSIWYRVTGQQFNFLVFNTEIIHVKHISPLSEYYGISPLDVLNNALTFDKAVKDFSLKEMKKKDAYIIKYDRSLDPKRREALIADFVKMVNDHGGAVVQEQGMQYERWEGKFQPSDLGTSTEITKKKIANVYNVPLTFLGETGQNAKSTESVMTQFVEMTLLPIVKQYESEFNRKLLTQNQRSRGYYFKFNVNGLMRGDTQSRTSFYQMMIRNGIATPNDLRKLEDLPIAKDKNADKLWFSKDLALLEQADKINAVTTTAEPQPTSNNNLEGGEKENADGDHETKDSNEQQTGSKARS
ncbi:phage portal protein, HK97 family [Lactobacillus hominis DSM 23910 = CRBIP 24.179]|nr:phage portal protein, HK97 family [Lactobacillus hominis DSM 23910 = CRBIP 24.179]